MICDVHALAKALAGRLAIVRGRVERGRATHAAGETAAIPLGAADVSSPAGSTIRAERYSPPAEYIMTATPEDIFYCFRLLLGRCPNPEEWPGHSSRAGEDVANVVSSYVTSREFAERGLLNKTYRDAVELVRLPRCALFVSKDYLAIGVHVLSGQPYEPEIAAIFDRYVKPGMAVVDIGANIG